MKKASIVRSFLLCTAAPSFLSAPVQAQEGNFPEADQRAAGEIIVTATRRQESTLSVPISIVALDTESLEKSNVTDINDLAAVVPGIEYNANSGLGPGTNTNISIRGVSAASGPSTTGIYIDETGIQGNSGTFPVFGNAFPAIFDLERVEVLRGPQGTLFGSGAMGGAIRFIQSQPSLTTFTGRAVAQIATTKGGSPTYEAGAAIGGPLIEDALGFRASAWHRRDGGYVDWIDGFTGDTIEENANFSETTNARLALAFAPTTNVTITPSLFYQRTKINHTGSFYDHISDVDDQVLQNDNIIRTPAIDDFIVASVIAEAEFGSVDLTTNTAIFNRNGDFTAESTFGLGAIFGGYGNPRGPSFPVSAADVAAQLTDVKRRVFMQEVRLSSADASAPLRWTVGGYYEKAKQTDSGSLFSASLPLFNEDLREIIFRNEQIAGFVEVDYELIPGMRLAAGTRYSHWKISGSAYLLGSQFAPDGYVYQLSFTDKAFAPKVSLDYQITDNTLIYATAARGVRPGGLNEPSDFPTCGFTSPRSYGSDGVWSYEVGTKNRLFGGQGTFTASAYQIDWSDFQTGISFDCGASYTANVGSARIRGFDVTLGGNLTDAFRADIAVTYIDAKLTSDVTTGIDSTERVIAKKGYALGGRSGAPAPWSLTASVEYAFEIGGHDGYIRAENIYKSKNKGPWLSDDPTSPSYSPLGDADPSRNMLNLRASITVNDIALALYVDNVLNELPLLAFTNWGGDNNWIQHNTVQPRTIGISADYTF